MINVADGKLFKEWNDFSEEFHNNTYGNDDSCYNDCMLHDVELV